MLNSQSSKLNPVSSAESQTGLQTSALPGRKSHSVESADPTGSKVSERSKKAWLMVYIALFSSLLAFFLVGILIAELEFKDEKRLYQRLVKHLYSQSVNYQRDYGLDWLKIDNTLNQGVRLSFDPKLTERVLQFDSAQAKIHSDFVPYLLQVTGLIQSLKLNQQDVNQRKLSAKLASQNKALNMIVRVAGHTDARPMAENARFADNVELSSFRAFAVMRYLQTHSLLSKTQFAISGYGDFHPVDKDPNAAENRRVEIYISPVIKPLDPVL